MHINEITEIEEGIFETILDFPDEKRLINLLLDETIPYVLLVDYEVGNFTWQKFKISGFENLEGLSRKISGDFIVPTIKFADTCLTSRWKYAIQLELQPPDYFEFKKIKGKQRYRILRDCGFRFIIESQPGGGDYAVLIAQSRELIERAINETTV
jgi:hypothetical protein